MPLQEFFCLMMSAEDLRFSVSKFSCSSSSELVPSFSSWGEAFSASLSTEITALIEKAKIQAVLDYKSRPRVDESSQVRPFNLSPWQTFNTECTEISSVPRPLLSTIKTRTTAISAPADLVLLRASELAELKERIASLLSEIDRLKLALQQEISDHQKTKLLLESRPELPAEPVVLLEEISDSLEPVAMTPLAPSSVQPSSLAPAEEADPEEEEEEEEVLMEEVGMQTEEVVFAAEKISEISSLRFPIICMHAEFPEELERLRRELQETKRRMHREFCAVHEEFGNFRGRATREAESLGKRLRESEGREEKLREEAAEEEKRRLELEFELDDLRTKFRTTVEFAEGVFSELERTKKFEVLATEAKNEIYTLKAFLKNIELVASENERQISEFNSTFCSAKEELVSAVRTFTSGFEYKSRPSPGFPDRAVTSDLSNALKWTQSPRRTMEKTGRHTFPALPPVEDNKKLWRRELEIPDTPRNKYI